MKRLQVILFSLIISVCFHNARNVYPKTKDKISVPGDNDDDTILDGVDDDDDNDGILDVDEIAACNNNLTFEFYDSVPSGNTVNNIPTSGAFAVGLVNSFDVDALVATLAQVNNTFSIRYTGVITIPTNGDYTFFTRSDDGSSLSIDGTLVVDNDGLHGARTRNGIINLTAGTHTIEVLFFENFGGEILEVEYQGPGIVRQDIPISVLSCNNDIDNDGLPNEFDTDSDGDGCPDALEGNGTFPGNILDTDNSFGDTVNTNGVALIGGISTQQSNISAYRSYITSNRCGNDNDNDGITDAFDLDDDNDGILDFDEVASCIGTLNYEYYDNTPAGNTVNNIPDTGPDLSGTFTSFDVDALIASLGEVNDRYGIRFTGLLNITTAGTYTFYTTSDDGSSLTIDEVLVVNNDDLHSSRERNGTIDLSIGAHFFEVLFFENTGLEILTVEYEGPGVTRQELPFTNIGCILDTDGDTIPNYFDTDSDDDGCLDAIEAEGSFTLSNIDISTNMLAGNIDTNGIPLLASPSGQPNNSAVINVGSVSENTFSFANVLTSTGGTASFNITVNEINGNTNFQWQQLDSSSGNFSNINNGGTSPVFSGTNTNTLTLDNIPINFNNTQYRVVFSNENTDCVEVISSIGILSLRPRTVVTNRRVTYRIKR